jgi:hypothetical protein
VRQIHAFHFNNFPISLKELKLAVHLFKIW